MAIYNIKLDLDEEYILLINDIFKYSVILLFIHLLLSFDNKKNIKIFGEFLNDDFLDVFAYIMLGFLFYYLVVKKIIKFT
jgi:hypothetical protein